MKLNAKRIYCFIEAYESQITYGISVIFAVYLVRLYFKNTESKNLGKLTKKEEKKLKKVSQDMRRRLKISPSEVAKLRGGGSYLTGAKSIATKIAIMTVNALKDGSIQACAVVIACKLDRRIEQSVKTICFGGNTDLIVAEIATNLYIQRQAFLRQLMANKELRDALSKHLLELGLIDKPLSRWDLFKFMTYEPTVFNFEIPVAKGCILAARTIAVLFVTNKVRQIIFNQFTMEVTKGLLIGLFSSPSYAGTEDICGIGMPQGTPPTFIGADAPKSLPPAPKGSPDSSVISNIFTPIFNDEIIDFIDIDPVAERLLGNPLPLIPYSPKFNIDSIIERLILGPYLGPEC